MSDESVFQRAQRLSTGIRGSFAAALAEAWFRADFTNRAKLEETWPNLFKEEWK